MVKQVVSNNEDMETVLLLTKKFHSNVQRLEKKDINQYETVSDILDSLTKLGKSKGEERRQIKREGAETIYEDENVLVLKPLNHKASCTYGGGTKWCITAKSTDSYWNAYTEKTSEFAGTDWYESEWVEERVEPNFIQRLMGKKPKMVKREIKNLLLTVVSSSGWAMGSNNPADMISVTGVIRVKGNAPFTRVVLVPQGEDPDRVTKDKVYLVTGDLARQLMERDQNRTVTLLGTLCASPSPE